MKKKGVPLPPFRVEDLVTRVLKRNYIAIINKMGKLLGSYDGPVKDAYIFEIIQQIREITASSDYMKRIEKTISKSLRISRQHFMKEFMNDAPDTIQVKVEYGLKSDAVFRHHLDELQNTYLKTSLERIEGEADELKKDFLREFIGYIEGDNDFSSLDEIMNKMKDTAPHRARFFARDQFAKFNKDMTVSLYKKAEIQYVKWYPMHDGRTRETHKTRAIKKKYGTDIFHISNLPIERLEYQCRCALIAVQEKNDV